MRHIFVLARLYPYIAIASILTLIQLSIHYRRKGRATYKYTIALGIFLGITILLWVFFRWDLNSDKYIKRLFMMD